MARWGFAATTTLLAAVALGVGGCGPADTTTAGGAAAGGAIEVVAGLGAEGQALAALGFDAADLDVDGLDTEGLDSDGLDLDPVAAPAPAGSAAPAPSASAAPGGTGPGKRAGDRPRRERLEDLRRKRQARVLLRRGTLHGEAVVQTKDGSSKTVVVQRGEVTAIDGDSMTVKSTDGVTWTWTFGEKLRVVERRTTVQPEQVKVGTKVGVAGQKDGDTNVASLVLVPRK